MRRSYPLLALLLLSCSDEIKPICPDVECIAPIKIKPVEDLASSERRLAQAIEDRGLKGDCIPKELERYGSKFSHQVCLL